MVRHFYFIRLVAVAVGALLLTALVVRPSGILHAGPPPAEGDLAVSLVDSADPVQSGASYSYSATIENIGGDDVGEEIDPQTGQPVGVEVRNLLPIRFQISSFSADFGGVCILQFDDVVCSFGVFAPGDKTTVTITGSVTTITDDVVLDRIIVDLPISHTIELIEVTNNIATEETTILAPLDSDGDTIPDKFETNTGVFLGPTDTGTDPNDPDTDDDGCTDGEELGSEEKLGGLRDPNNFWDFYDVWTRPVGDPLGWERSRSVDLFGDIFGVATRFGTSGDLNGDPLTPPGNDTSYHTSFDRSPPLFGEDPWDTRAADGIIDSFADIFAVAFQFGHSCVAQP